MPLYMDIHKGIKDTTPQELAAAHEQDVATQDSYGVKYLRWWYNQDLGSVYCLVQAPSADAATEVHQAAHGLVADEIIPIEPGDVDGFIGPDEGGAAMREDPVGTINTDPIFRTIVFTDLEDSTPLTNRIGDEAYVELLKVHDDLMHASLHANDGMHVKHTGDGMMASFISVAKAVQCMIDMQCALAEHNAANPDRQLRARIGAAAGEPVDREGDLFGAAVNLASRLSSHAAPGEIVVAGVVRDLCIGKQFTFAERGHVEVKGFDEPQRVYEVRWAD
jgi:class 3 adenylate cyclase